MAPISPVSGFLKNSGFDVGLEENNEQTARFIRFTEVVMLKLRCPF